MWKLLFMSWHIRQRVLHQSSSTAAPVLDQSSLGTTLLIHTVRDTVSCLSLERLPLSTSPLWLQDFKIEAQTHKKQPQRSLKCICKHIIVKI